MVITGKVTGLGHFRDGSNAFRIELAGGRVGAIDYSKEQEEEVNALIGKQIKITIESNDPQEEA